MTAPKRRIPICFINNGFFSPFHSILVRKGLSLMSILVTGPFDMEECVSYIQTEIYVNRNRMLRYVGLDTVLPLRAVDQVLQESNFPRWPFLVGSKAAKSLKHCFMQFTNFITSQPQPSNKPSTGPYCSFQANANINYPLSFLSTFDPDVYRKQHRAPGAMKRKQFMAKMRGNSVPESFRESWLRCSTLAVLRCVLRPSEGAVIPLPSRWHFINAVHCSVLQECTFIVIAKP